MPERPCDRRIRLRGEARLAGIRDLMVSGEVSFENAKRRGHHCLLVLDNNRWRRTGGVRETDRWLRIVIFDIYQPVKLNNCYHLVTFLSIMILERRAQQLQMFFNEGMK